MREDLRIMWWTITDWLYNTYQDVKEWLRGEVEEAEER